MREQGELTLRFVHQNNDVPMPLGAFTYAIAAGNDYRVLRLEYLVTDIRIYQEDGGVVELSPIEYVVASSSPTAPFVFDVPAARYTRIEFRWGVDPEAVRMNLPVEYFLGSGFAGMEWSADPIGGYYHMRLEGIWDTNPAASGFQEAPFALDTGYLRDCRDAATDFEACPVVDQLEFEGSFVVDLGGFSLDLEEFDASLEIGVDIGDWIDDAGIDFGQAWADQTICPNQPATTCELGEFPELNPELQQLMFDNRDGAFVVVAVVESPANGP